MRKKPEEFRSKIFTIYLSVNDQFSISVTQQCLTVAWLNNQFFSKAINFDNFIPEGN